MCILLLLLMPLLLLNSGFRKVIRAVIPLLGSGIQSSSGKQKNRRTSLLRENTVQVSLKKGTPVYYSTQLIGGGRPGFFWNTACFHYQPWLYISQPPFSSFDRPKLPADIDWELALCSTPIPHLILTTVLPSVCY